MKKFVRNTILFLLPMLVFLSAMSYYRYSKLMTNVRKGVIKYQSKKGFFVGDSHIEAIDVYARDSSYANLGQGGEPTDVSVSKMKLILAKNTHVTVYLGLSENNIVNNPSMTEENRRRHYKYDLYASKNKPSFILSNFKDFLHFVTFESALTHGFGDGRGTTVRKTFDPKSVKDPHFSVMRFHYSDTSIDRPKLIKLITDFNDYVNSRQSKLILLNCPATVLYKQNIPKSVYDSYNALLDTFVHKNIQIVNYEHLDLNDSLFHDMNHLNENGSRTILSIMFAKEKAPVVSNPVDSAVKLQQGL